MEQATLRLSDGRTWLCDLSPDGAILRELLACLPGPARPEDKVLKLRTPEGEAKEIPVREIVGLELPPPFCLIRDFLTPAEQDRARAHTLAREAAFHDATISLPSTQGNSTPDYRLRRSRILDDVEPLLAMVVPKLHVLVPKLWGALRMNPINLSRLECQITAHGDGDFFNTHTDNALPDIAHRQVSYVYYFHREPKQFTGGHLNLYNSVLENGMNTCGARGVEIDPPGNSLMVFPSHVHHEVTPIQCASTALADQRLTLNGWLCI